MENGAEVFFSMTQRMKSEKPFIRLTKLNELADAKVPNNIEEGFAVEGLMLRPVKVGESFYVGYDWATSVVQEILSENTFKTRNSIYKLEIIKKP